MTLETFTSPPLVSTPARSDALPRKYAVRSLLVAVAARRSYHATCAAPPKVHPPGMKRRAICGTARPPNGESMAELQRRIVIHLRAMHDASPDGRIVLVTHAEVIRAAVLHALHMRLDDFARIEIAPASINTLAVGSHGCELVALNRAVPT